MKKWHLAKYICPPSLNVSKRGQYKHVQIMALSTSAHNTQIINTFKLNWSYNFVENLTCKASDKISNMNEKVPQDKWKSFWMFSKTVTDNVKIKVSQHSRVWTSYWNTRDENTHIGKIQPGQIPMGLIRTTGQYGKTAVARDEQLHLGGNSFLTLATVLF